jgi:hypothetical protein
MGKLSDLFVKLRLDNKQYNSELNESKKKTSAFGKGVGKIGGLIAGAFAVSQIVSFGKELVMIGGVAEGVREAFNRMASDNTLKDLQEATAGTVGELELMKRAVSAKNLGLPIEDLANLFEFATKRAQETGESVDFLVNSIVTGIGRKSPLILDNLGISAIELRKQLEGVGFESAKVSDIAAAVGRIAAESMAESGKIIDTNAIKVATLTANWDNFKLKLSENKTLIETIGDSLQKTSDIMVVWTSDYATTLEKWAIAFELFDKRAEQIVKQVKAREEAEKKLAKQQKEQAAIDDNSARNQIAAEQDLLIAQSLHVKTIGELKAETDDLKESLELYNVEQGAEIQKTLAQIKANEELIKSLTTLRTERGEAPAAISTRGDVPQIAAPFINDDNLDVMFDFFKKMDEQLANFTNDYWADYDMFLEGLNELTESGVEDLVATFAEGLGRLAAGDIGFEEFFSVILDSIGSFLGQMGKMLIAYGIGMTAFKTAFTNPIAAIAAGVALVAIGGAISGAASRGPSGLGGGGGGGSANTAAFNVINTNAQDQKLVASVSGNDLNFVLTKFNTNQGRI